MQERSLLSLAAYYRNVKEASKKEQGIAGGEVQQAVPRLMAALCSPHLPVRHAALALVQAALGLPAASKPKDGLPGKLSMQLAKWKIWLAWEPLMFARLISSTILESWTPGMQGRI